MPEALVSYLPLDSTDLSALPVLPAVVKGSLEVFDDDKVNFQRLTQLVSYDVTLTARMLAVANSAAYGDRAPRVLNLERACAVLGPGTTRTIIATTAIHQSLSRPHGIPASVLTGFWRHSLTCAHLARRLALVMGYPEPDEAYLSGLLHDIGKLFIDVRYNGAFQEARTLAPFPSEVTVLERRLFGADHCELGAALVETWKLCSFLADAIRFHHSSAEELRGAHPLPRLLYVANALSQEELQQTAFADAEILLGLPVTLVEKAQAEVEREVERLVVDLDVAVPAADDQNAMMLAPICLPQEQAIYERALVNEVRVELSSADDEPTLLDAIVRSATILLDLPEVHIFPYNTDTGIVGGRESDPQLREIAIDPNGAVNVVNQALRERQVSHSLGEGTARAGIVDRQLTRLWRTEGVLCLPLYTPTQVLGGLVAGVSRAQLPRLLAQTRLLRLFAAAMATELGELRQREARQRRALEDRHLLEQQRLRTVLHEVSNPLTIARNYLHLLAARLDPSMAREELKVLQEETERVGRILVRLAESDDTGLEEPGFDLNRTVRGLGRVLDDALCRSRGIRLNLNLMEGIPPLARGRDAIRQVLLNLVRNAAEALEAQGPNGAITVTTRDGVNLQGRQYVELAVADNGPGLPDDLRSRLFQPVASKKGSGHGGLGLAIVKSLVEKLGGYVIYHPNSDGGTVFLVLLPRT